MESRNYSIIISLLSRYASVTLLSSPYHPARRDRAGGEEDGVRNEDKEWRTRDTEGETSDMHSASLSSLTPYRSLSIRASTPLPTVGSALYTRLPLPSVVSLRREWNEGRKA